MTLLVDTSVWSLALRRDVPADEPEVQALRDALAGTEVVVTTGCAGIRLVTQPTLEVQRRFE